MCSLFSDVLSNLEPSQNFCINAAIKGLSPSPSLFLLCDLKQVSDRFTKSIQGFIQGIDQSKYKIILIATFLLASIVQGDWLSGHTWHKFTGFVLVMHQTLNLWLFTYRGVNRFSEWGVHGTSEYDDGEPKMYVRSPSYNQ